MIYRIKNITKNQFQNIRIYQNKSEYENYKLNRIEIDKLISNIDKNRRDILIDSIDLSIYVINEFEKLNKILTKSNQIFNDLIVFKHNTINKIK